MQQLREFFAGKSYALKVLLFAVGTALVMTLGGPLATTAVLEASIITSVAGTGILFESTLMMVAVGGLAMVAIAMVSWSMFFAHNYFEQFMAEKRLAYDTVDDDSTVKVHASIASYASQKGLTLVATLREYGTILKESVTSVVRSLCQFAALRPAGTFSS